MAAKNRFNPIDCLAAALPDEEHWTLLARDPAMPAMLGIWASLRVGNLEAATENFMLLMSPELLQHYRSNPDIAKSAETVETANRAADWRERNLNGSNGRPTWKDSLVRPQMMAVQIVGDIPAAAPGQMICPVCQEFSCECEKVPADLLPKIATGLRQVTADMIGQAEARMEDTSVDSKGFLSEAMDQYADRINGYAAEIEAAINPDETHGDCA